MKSWPRFVARVPGLADVNSVWLREGLQVNDQVVLSDMSQWDSRDRIRILN